MANFTEQRVLRATDNYNLNLVWSTPWNNFDQPIVDQPGRYEITLRSTSGSTPTADVTPRRLQPFQVRDGQVYRWENRDAATGTLLASGQATAAGLRIDASARGNRLLLVPADGIAGRHRGFLVGNYFLLQGERTYLNILEDRDVNGMTWYPEYDINLGAPLGPVANSMQTYDLADGVDDAVYRRDFTNGRVIVNDVRVVEGQSGSTLATFTISLSASSTQSVTVSYATIAGTAAAGSDFTASSGQLSFAPGERTRTLSVPVLGDTTDESDESFSLVLSSAVNATIADATGVGTITDDEDPPAGQQIVVTDAIDTYLTGVQNRTANLGGAATINFYRVPDSASSLYRPQIEFNLAAVLANTRVRSARIELRHWAGERNAASVARSARRAPHPCSTPPPLSENPWPGCMPLSPRMRSAKRKLSRYRSTTRSTYARHWVSKVGQSSSNTGFKCGSRFVSPAA